MASKLPEILSRIKPSKLESSETLQKVKKFISELDAKLRKNKISAKTLLGGSFAKDTWLKGDYDVDLFVKFPASYSGKDISALTAKALKPWKFRELHGSRDYFQIQDEIHYEIIPILDITGKVAENVTDYSYMHVELVKKQPLKIKDDIRMFKQLLKANRIYGAESYINGFSGHVVDLLVIYYKGFLPLIRALKTWKAKKVIDMKNTHKGKALFVLNASKTQGPLVLIDNIQPERNAAAAVGEYAFAKLISLAKNFNPNKPSLFEIQPVDFSSLAKKGKLIKAYGSHVEGTTDVAGTKLLKAHEKIISSLKDFGVIKTGWDFNAHTHQAVFWYLLKNLKLPLTYEARGPPITRKEATAAFKKAHKRTFAKKGYLWCVRKRDVIDAKKMIDKVIKQNSDRIQETRIE